MERMVCDLQRASFLWSGLGEQKLPWTDGRDVSLGGRAVKGGVLRRSTCGSNKAQGRGRAELPVVTWEISPGWVHGVRSPACAETAVSDQGADAPKIL